MNRTTSLRTLVLCGALPLCAAGCGDASPRHFPDDQDGSGEIATEDLARSTAPPGALDPGDGGGAVFAVHRITIGSPPNRGSPGEPAWFDQGFDLDDTATSPGGAARSCEPPAAAPAGSDIDGPEGVDNAFGRAAASILGAATGPLEDAANLALARGASALLFEIDGLGQTTTGLDARVYIGAPLGAPPRLDGTQIWPVAYESVSNGDVESPLVTLRWISVAGGGQQGTCAGDAEDVIEVRLAALGASDRQGVLRLRVHAPVVSMRFAAGGARVQGAIGGKLLVSELHAEAARFFRHVASFLCEGELLDGILAKLDRLADIRGDGALDPDLPCDAISFGIGFEAVRARLGDVAHKTAALPDPCAM